MDAHLNNAGGAWWIVGLVLAAVLSIVPIGLGPVAAQPDLEQLGVTSDTEYESPQFGNSVTWTDDWTVDDESVESNERQSLDRLSIVHGNGARVQVFFVASTSESPDEYAERFLDYRRGVYPDLKLLDESDRNGERERGEEGDAVMLFYSFEEAGDRFVGLVEISTVDDEETLRIVEFVSYPDVAEELFDVARQDIRVDGRLIVAGMSDLPQVPTPSTPSASSAEVEPVLGG